MGRTLAAGGFICSMVLATFLWTATASAQSGYFTSKGCSVCHVTATATCNGCHAHGTHPSSAKSSINLAGVTKNNAGVATTSFTPGQAMQVTISGGYRTNWVRALLYDQNLNELARSTGTNSAGGGPVGGAALPVTFTTTAPLTPGTYTWKVAWYGNKYDLAEAGGTTVFGAGWTPDPTNPNHGREVVSTNTFTVVAPPAPVISFNPASLPFGAVPAATTSTLTTAIQNTGNATLNVTGIALCNGTSTAFTWTPAAPFSISAGGSQTVAVTYAPLSAANDTGCLQVSSNAAVNPAVLNLSGASQVLLPVRAGAGYYSSIQAAYNANIAATVEIDATATTFSENINFTNNAVAVNMQGGYNTGYTGKAGDTVVVGTVTITGGAVTVENLIIS